MRVLLLLMAGALLAACEAPPSSDQAEPDPADSGITAEALDEEVARLAEAHDGGEALWPGFDPLAVPLAVHDGRRTLLFRHPSPPVEFAPVSPDSAVFAVEGRHDSVFANTAVEIGGVLTATVLPDQFPPDLTLAEAAGVAIHEAFHAFQRERYPDWGANEVDLLTYPVDSGELLTLRRLETRALAAALRTDDPGEAACRARTALDLREDRFDRMDPAFPAYERGTELNEGLAVWVERRSAGSKVDLPAEGFPANAVRERALRAGAAYATLLDRMSPEWRSALGTGGTGTLDAALSEAVDPVGACGFGAETVAEAEEAARRDVADLDAERRERLTDFEAREGWRVVVEASVDDPLRLASFDPVNVEPLDARRLLHTRFLRLGNDSGSLEILGARALTEGAGDHPIFDGVVRVVLTGLKQPEVISTAQGVRLGVPGLDLEFEGATVSQAEEERQVIVRLER